MTRTSTPLNIETLPGIGMSYIVRNVETQKYVRVATCCQRDIKRRGFKFKSLRALSGDEPFFLAKIGSLRTGTQVLKFLCGSQHKMCLDKTGTYEWCELSVADARLKNLEFSEPGLLDKNEKVVAKVTKAKKPAKVTKAKKAVKAKKAKAKLLVEEITPEVVPEELIMPETEAVVNTDQSDTEFAAEIDADHQKALAQIANR